MNRPDPDDFFTAYISKTKWDEIVKRIWKNANYSYCDLSNFQLDLPNVTVIQTDKFFDIFGKKNLYMSKTIVVRNLKPTSKVV